jgi:hypothetical protein
MMSFKSFVALFFVLCISIQCTQSLTVHLVCHTHDDVGWLKTVDQYYMGLNQSIYQANVQQIIDSVIDALAMNENRTFVYVEQAFFQRWWRQQNDARRELARTLAKKGQLEFINGGWCMHDEAATFYVDMIDQTTLGHRFLLDEFGSIPTIGWQIDPFGHSATQAALLSAEVGFDGLFFGRIDYQDHNIRMADKNMEFIWRASASFGENAQVFSGAFQSGNYGAPDGMCFDINCGQDAVNDDPNLEDNNVAQYVEKFVQDALSQAAATRGNIDDMNIMWTLGSDFLHENSNFWFASLDRLIKAVNADGRVKAVYSTPSRYVKAKNAEQVQWTVKTDDFFPYADGANNYWTGYFTSRPALKRYVRDMSAYLQVVRQLEVFTGANGNTSELFWEGLSVAQHHDGVSGTSKQHVAYDYARGIAHGVEAADTYTNYALGELVSTGNGVLPPSFTSCELANISICPTSQTAKEFVVALYNPQARTRSEVVIIPVSSKSVTVVNSTGSPITFQNIILASNQATNASSAQYAVAFEANVAGLGLNSYFIQNNVPEHTMATMSVNEPQGSIIISNDVITVTFDTDSGLIVNVTDIQSGTTYPFTQDYGYYKGYSGNGQHSGAYIFRPDTPSATPTKIRGSGSSVKTILLSSGPLVHEVQQIFSPWVSQIVRLRANTRHIEFEWTVGSVDISDHVGKEVVSIFTTDIDSQSIFYTDSNGREVQGRERNYRPTWKWDPTQPVAGNYYPVNSGIGLGDDASGLIVNVDRAQGCSSLNDGQIECMLHRRLLVDDGRGVGEPLNETAGILPDGTRLGEGLVITGHHYVHVMPGKDSFDAARILQDKVYQPLHPFYAPIQSVDSYIKDYKTSFTAVQTDLPINIELMTLQPWRDGAVLIRLSHQFGVNEGNNYNKPVTVDLSTIFTAKLDSVTELSLTANQLAGQHKPYTWNTTDTTSNAAKYPRIPLAGTTVTINPMEIRTFSATFN